jgi:hypothetical protein
MASAGTTKIVSTSSAKGLYKALSKAGTAGRIPVLSLPEVAIFLKLSIATELAVAQPTADASKLVLTHLADSRKEIALQFVENAALQERKRVTERCFAAATSAATAPRSRVVLASSCQACLADRFKADTDATPKARVKSSSCRRTLRIALDKAAMAAANAVLCV